MKSREKKRQSGLFNVQLKNETRFRLLLMQPKLQSEVKSIRSEFGIPPNGFESEEKLNEWQQNTENKPYIEIIPYELKARSQNPFKERLDRLGEAFNLPFHFYHSSEFGLPCYVLTDKLIVPKNNWDIDLDVRAPHEYPRWVGIRAYAPLSEIEIREAVKQLKIDQQEELSKGVMVSTRVRKQFERDLKLIGAWPSERGRPARIKRFKQGSFLAKLGKSGKYSKQQLKEWARAQKDEGSNIYEVVSSKTTSRTAARGNKKASDAFRQAKRRLNKLAKQLFGYDLEA